MAPDGEGLRRGKASSQAICRPQNPTMLESRHVAARNMLSEYSNCVSPVLRFQSSRRISPRGAHFSALARFARRASPKVSMLALAFLSQMAIAQQPKKVSIVLTKDWTPTGVRLVEGQTFTVRASGDLNWFTPNRRRHWRGCPVTNKCHTTPEGQSCPYAGFLAQGLACWSLIGRIDDGPAFKVGSSLENFPAPSSGELSLGVNDNNYWDNTGTWTAEVTTCPTLPTPGDVVVYFGPGGAIVHVAVIAPDGVQKNPNGPATVVKVISKWGDWGVYGHDPDDTLHYGKEWAVYHTARGSNRLRELANGQYETDKQDPISLVRPDDSRVTETEVKEILDHSCPGLYERLDRHPEFPPQEWPLFDCRGYVFADGKVRINQVGDDWNTYGVADQVIEVLHDNLYCPVPAKHTGGHTCSK
jgi:hypothetical protein